MAVLWHNKIRGKYSAWVLENIQRQNTFRLHDVSVIKKFFLQLCFFKKIAAPVQGSNCCMGKPHVSWLIKKAFCVCRAKNTAIELKLVVCRVKKAHLNFYVPKTCLAQTSADITRLAKKCGHTLQFPMFRKQKNTFPELTEKFGFENGGKTNMQAPSVLFLLDTTCAFPQKQKEGYKFCILFYLRRSRQIRERNVLFFLLLLLLGDLGGLFSDLPCTTKMGASRENFS